MPILRKHHTNNFTIIPNEVFNDKNLSLKDVGLLCFLLHLPNDWEFSVNGLASIMPNDGKDAVTASLKRLEQAGYIHRERERIEGGKYAGTVWHIFESPMTDFPAQDNTAQEIPAQENTAQISKYLTKEEETKEEKNKERINKNNNAHFPKSNGQRTAYQPPFSKEELNEMETFVDHYINELYPQNTRHEHPTVAKSKYKSFARKLLDCAKECDLTAEEIQAVVETALDEEEHGDMTIFLATTPEQLSYWLVRTGTRDVVELRGTKYDYEQLVANSG